MVTQSKSQILTSKARVAPVKNRTIPQMELTALFIGTKLGKHIREKLNYLTIEHTYIWCDNEAVLQWVKNDHSKLPYVKNRVAKIYEMQNDFHFLYVDTKSNPADILSRGTTSKNLSNSILWFHGPQRLKEKPAWPDQKLGVISSINNVDVNMEKNDDEAQFLMDITKFSSLGKLLRVTNYVSRFIKNIYMKRGWTKNINDTNSMTFWV